MENKEKPKNPHTGHRLRVKQKFLKNGFENMLDYEILEMLLFYSVPYKNTNVIAHNLINTFGSISSVFDSSVENLKSVEGITENSAILIKMIPNLLQVYNTDKYKLENVFNVKKACDVFLKKFIGVINETVYLALADSAGRLIYIGKISEGNLNKSHIYVRKLISTVLQHNAKYAILSHNHPSGIALPSQSDIETTKKLKSILANLDIILIDHIIVANNDAVSMKSNEDYKNIFNTD